MTLRDWIELIGVIVTGIPVIGGQIVLVINAMHNRNAVANVAAKVTAVHQEVRPPSNGTTNGALLEGLALGNRTQLGMIGEALGVKVPDNTPPIPQVEPPERPPESPFGT